MTGGMAFIYDEKNDFENCKFYLNSLAKVETDYWKKFLKSNITEFQKTKQVQKKPK